MSDDDVEPLLGWVDDAVAAEFPDLRLRHVTLEVNPGRSPEPVRERLRTLSSRFTGARAVTLRRESVPAAYRVFFHHIGLDPDEQRTPIERAALERLIDGEFASGDVVEDALLIALVETGVAVAALDAERVAGPPGIRESRSGEPLGSGDRALPLVGGRLIVADERCAVAHLFGEVAPSHRVRAATRRALLYAVEVPGVPAIHVDEALWQCGEALQTRW
jgi:DNA/RNA-binding domain of Phe-tRNA-synthetase-like protein